MKKGDIAVILPEQPHAMFQYENEQANYINIVFDLEFLKSNGAASYLYNKYIAPFVKGDRTINPYIPQSSAMNQQIRSYVQELFESRYESYTNDELPNPAVKPLALAMGI